MPNFLGEHPKIFKIKTTQDIRPKKLICEQDLDQKKQEIISQHLLKIRQLSSGLQAMSEKIRLTKESLEFYDPEVELREIDAKLALAGCEQEQLNQQIENCQKVEHNTSPSEYFLWKKKQRSDTFEIAMSELYRTILQNKEAIEKKISENREQCDQLHLQIAELEEEIKDGTEEPSEKNQESQTVTLKDLIQQNNELREEYMGLQSTINILQQNNEILHVQLVDGIDTIESSLLTYFESEKIRLARELKLLKGQMQGKQVSPLGNDEHAYSIDPLISDYAYRLQQIGNTVPQELKKDVQTLLKPLDWQSTNWMQAIQARNKSLTVYDEYHELQLQCMNNEEELKKLSQSTVEINNETATYQQRNKELTTAILKITKMLEK